jgi:hypothetical protein
MLVLCASSTFVFIPVEGRRYQTVLAYFRHFHICIVIQLYSQGRTCSKHFNI